MILIKNILGKNNAIILTYHFNFKNKDLEMHLY